VKSPKLLLAITLLVCAVGAYADSIPLTSGFGRMQNPSLGIPFVVWTFHGPGVAITQLLTGDTGKPGLLQCSPCEDPLALDVLWLDMEDFDGSGLVNGVPTFFNVFMGIGPLSATGHTRANGDLVVTYLASGEIALIAVDSNDFPLGQRYSINKNWFVTASFIPLGSGTWDFQRARFTMVPEPGTMVMVGSGLLLLSTKLLKFKRNPKTRNHHLGAAEDFISG
jgi:hypothetical protein